MARSADAFEERFAPDTTFENGLELAYAYQKAGRHQELGRLLDTLAGLARSPDDRFGLGRLLMDVGRPADGVDLLRSAHDEDPQDVERLSAFASALAYVGDLEEASRCVDQLRRLDPSSALTHATAGIVALRGDDAATALAEFERSLAREPMHFQMMAFKGFALRRLGRDPEAFEVFRRIEREAPEILDQEDWSSEWRALQEQRPDSK